MRRTLASGVACLLVILPGNAAIADDDSEDVESLRCLNARSIRGADVIDDDHVVFEIQGRRLFLNVLPKTCTGLSKDRRFSYGTFTRSLCSRDKIRILKESGGRVYESRACSLGRFQPITVDELEAYLKDRTVPESERELDPPDIEDVATDATRGERRP